MDRLLRRDFFFPFASLLIVAIVAYGFGRTLDAKFIHPDLPRPGLLYVHAAAFAAWVALFVTQTALVRAHNVRLHRKLGLFGIALGCTIPPLGVATAIVMTRFDMAHGAPDGAGFLILPFFYMLAFAGLFGAAAFLRSKPEFHRRLMFVATCTLTVAAFARFPGLPVGVWDVCVDALIGLGVARDWILTKSVHPAYRYALPPLVAGQIAANAVLLSGAAWWLAIAHGILRT